MKQLISIFAFIYLSTFSFSQQVGQIGSDFDNCEGTPAYGLFDYSQTAMLYLATELEGIGISSGNSITAIEFQFNSWDDGYVLDNQTIKISHVTESSIPSPSSPDYSELTISNTTTVVDEFDFRGKSSIHWEQFDFDTPFVWDGVSNILITWENRDGSWSGGYGWLEGRSIANRCHIWIKDDNYPVASSSEVRDLPNIKLHTTFNPLPITLLEFKGELLNNENHVSVKLDWTTASEKDNNYFTVWRSLDGQDWEEIFNLVGAGNSNHEIKYQYIDQNINLQRASHKTIYYRLSQTDYDGTKEYFQIIPIELKSKKTHVVKRTNLMGQKIVIGHKGLIIETWNNGYVSKSFN